MIIGFDTIVQKIPGTLSAEFTRRWKFEAEKIVLSFRIVYRTSIDKSSSPQRVSFSHSMNSSACFDSSIGLAGVKYSVNHPNRILLGFSWGAWVAQGELPLQRPGLNPQQQSLRPPAWRNAPLHTDSITHIYSSDRLSYFRVSVDVS